MTPSETKSLALSAAEIMEPHPWLDDDIDPNPVSREGWWEWDFHDSMNFEKREPHHRLDGTDPDADAYACHLMKARLIECGLQWFTSTFNPNRQRQWAFVTQEHGLYDAPTEVLAVAKALIAVDEARKLVQNETTKETDK
jgi:hypothetical protein